MGPMGPQVGPGPGTGTGACVRPEPNFCAHEAMHIPKIARVSKIKFETLFMDLWPNPGPGCLPLDSGGGDVEFTGAFASVASLAKSFVSEIIF